MIKFFDGAMGSMLNLAAGELPEQLNITDPDRVFAVHKGYAEADADFITANTFGANSLKYDNVAELVKAGVALAKKTGKKVALDIGPTGKLLKPMGDLDFEKDIRIDINHQPEKVDKPYSHMLGPVYQTKASYKGSKVTVYLTPFTDSSQWFRPGEPKPDKNADAFTYGIWLYKEEVE